MTNAKKINREKVKKFIMTRGIALVLTILLFATAFVAVATMVVTDIKLAFISFDISWINSDGAEGLHHWDDSVTEIYNSDMAKRQALCHSENRLVAVFASSGHLMRIGMLLASVVILVISLLLVIALANGISKAYRMLRRK